MLVSAASIALKLLQFDGTLIDNLRVKYLRSYFFLAFLIRYNIMSIFFFLNSLMDIHNLSYNLVY